MENEIDLTHSDLSDLEKLKEYTFDSKMLYCQRYSSRIMTISEVSQERMHSEGIMPWEIEAFAAFSVIYDSPDATKLMTDNVFCETITLLRNYWHPELTMAEENGVYPDYFMMISILQQFPTQGVFLQKLFRYNYFFNFSNEKLDMKSIFVETFGNDYRKFELLAFIVFSHCSIDGQNRLTKEQSWRGLNKAFSIGTVRQQLSIEKEKYKEQLESLYHGNTLDYYYGLKIQYLYPIIEDVDCSYLPSPYLVVNAVTESLLNRLTMGNSGLRRAFGKEVIEEYLYSIYKELETVSWISREFKYNIGRDTFLTPDVLVEEMGNAVLFDTKALSPSLKMRQFDTAEIEKETNTYADNILQVYRRILDLQNGYYSLNNSFDLNNIYGVVVVLEDAAVPKYRVYNRVWELLRENESDNSPEVCDYIHSHIKVVPLYQIEQMVLLGHSYMECLLRQAADRNKWDDYSFFIKKDSFSFIPIYQNYCDGLKHQATELLTSE